MADSGHADGGRDRRWVVALAGAYALAVLIYALLGAAQAIPLITPDEFTYGHLARSLADGTGTSWRGASEGLRAALYVYAITPAWLTGSATKAYALAKIEGTLLVSLAIVPTWLLARRFVGPRVALFPAVLSVAGAWMTTASLILTENLAYPLAAAALAATVVGVAAPRSRAPWLALALAVLASWARLQCAVLIPIIVVAILIRAVAGGGGRDALRSQSAILAVGGGISLTGVILALADPSLLGNYGVLADTSPALGSALAKIGHQWVGLVAMSGLVPVPLVLAASTRRAAWRDPGAGPLLAVTWAASLLFLVQSGWAISVLDVEWHIERYVEYAMPVLLTTAVVVVHRGFVTRRAAGVAVALTAALLLLAPPARLVVEERAAFALGLRGDDLLGTGTATSLALAMVLAGAIAIALIFRKGIAGGAAAAAALALVAGGVMLVQDQAGWKWQLDFSRASRVLYPRDLAWIDHAGDGPVAHLIVGASAGHLRITDFFNRDIEQVYLMEQTLPQGIRGGTCRWAIQPAGEIQFSGPCEAPPQRFYIDDGFSHVSFHGETLEARASTVGKVVRVPGPPRVRSVINFPCQEPAPTVNFAARGEITHPQRQCATQVTGQLWLDEAGTVELRFRGDGAPHGVVATGTQFTVAPTGDTVVPVPVAAGAPTLEVGLDWDVPSPALVGLDLVQGGKRVSLM